MSLRAWLITLAACVLITAFVITVADDRDLTTCQTFKCLEGM
jgi:hypothetical protein